MMYSEFINLTKYGKSYITFEDYTEFIEPAYLAMDVDKIMFCKKFRNHFAKMVQDPVEMIIRSKTVDELQMYLNGDESIIKDAKEVENTLKTAFLKQLLKKLRIGDYY